MFFVCFCLRAGEIYVIFHVLSQSIACTVVVQVGFSSVWRNRITVSCSASITWVNRFDFTLNYRIFDLYSLSQASLVHDVQNQSSRRLILCAYNTTLCAWFHVQSIRHNCECMVLVLFLTANSDCCYLRHTWLCSIKRNFLILSAILCGFAKFTGKGSTEIPKFFKRDYVLSVQIQIRTSWRQLNYHRRRLFALTMQTLVEICRAFSRALTCAFGNEIKRKNMIRSNWQLNSHLTVRDRYLITSSLFAFQFMLMVMRTYKWANHSRNSCLRRTIEMPRSAILQTLYL